MKSGDIMKKSKAYWGFIAPGMVLYTVFMIIPIVFAMYYSFFEWNGIGPMKFIGLANYEKLLCGGRMSRIFFRALGNNFKYLASVLVIITPLQIFFAAIAHQQVSTQEKRRPYDDNQHSSKKGSH